jgi:hypothetical protein
MNLGGVWILYSKQLSEIFMHKMYFQEKLGYLVRILAKGEYILGKMYFANSHLMSRNQKSTIFWILILASDSHFC